MFGIGTEEAVDLAKLRRVLSGRGTLG
jgi:hypothetical protein